MDIHATAAEGRDKGRAEDAHVAGEDDPIDAGGAEMSDHVGVMHFARCAPGDLQSGGQAKVSGGLKAGCGGDV